MQGEPGRRRKSPLARSTNSGSDNTAVPESLSAVKSFRKLSGEYTQQSVNVFPVKLLPVNPVVVFDMPCA